MTPPTLTFLTSRESLAEQVAGELMSLALGFPPDLSGIQVWIPTSGAARRVRLALAEMSANRSTGVLSPEFLQPMQALLGRVPHNLASPVESEAAWALAIERAQPEDLDALFPVPPSGTSDLLSAGGILSGLCNLLAEGGRSPTDPLLSQTCTEDALRWDQLSALYKTYLDILARAGLSDANALRLKNLGNPEFPFRTLVIACIPDLPAAARIYAENLLVRGVNVKVLVWHPAQTGGDFDAWGCPDPETWNSVDIPLCPAQITRGRDPSEEFRGALNFLSGANPGGDYALVMVDPELSQAAGAAILERGGSPFLPGGDSLASTEPGMVALLWEEWTRGHSLEILRRLLECPSFAGWVGRRLKIPLSRLLACCDDLLAVHLCSDLDGAAVLPRDSTEDNGEDQKKALPSLVDFFVENRNLSTGAMLAKVFRKPGPEARAVLDLWDACRVSPLFQEHPQTLSQAFVRSVQASKTFDASSPGQLELHGWLEAPWLDARRLIVTGCTEGNLPATINEHPFLPDSRRKLLGIAGNDTRSARDAFLVSNLALSRPPEEIRFSFSKHSGDGSPNLPSRLLLRCVDAELPGRIRDLFQPAEVRALKPSRSNGWKWSLPEKHRHGPPEKVSPTDFSQYLACPFRFYFSRRLYLEEFDPRAREMDAMTFGTLVHKALERFGLGMPLESNEQKIANSTLAFLDEEAKALFGPRPGPAVRIQLEAARVRLRAFARVQAQERAAGWEIVAVERKLSHKDPDPLLVGGLPLSGKIDRIEIHPELGVRVMDYKTFSTPHTPEKKHFGSRNAVPFLPEAQVERNGKPRTWADLQLPLYREIAARWHPGLPVRTGYFLLPSDPELTSVAELELDEDEQAFAMNCAAAIVNRLLSGIYWPPVEFKGSWEDPLGGLFVNGPVTECFTEDTLNFFQGKP